MALVLITHDMGVVAETAKRVMVHYAGQQVEHQDIKGLFANPHHPYTSALLAALPERASSQKLLPSIAGVVPGQFDRPPGCLFSPRCRFATELCRTSEPAPASAELGSALCHYPLDNGVPLNHPQAGRRHEPGSHPAGQRPETPLPGHRRDAFKAQGTAQGSQRRHL
jgi:dipeptide transport system ATP-binding protein